MHHRFTAHEQEIANVILDRHIDGQFGFIERDTAARARIEFGAREPAEIAIGVADIGDGKLQITRATVVQDLAEKLERAFPGPRHRLRKITGRRWRIRFRLGRGCDGRSIIHAKAYIVARANVSGKSSFDLLLVNSGIGPIISTKGERNISVISALRK